MACQTGEKPEGGWGMGDVWGMELRHYVPKKKSSNAFWFCWNLKVSLRYIQDTGAALICIVKEGVYSWCSWEIQLIKLQIYGQKKWNSSCLLQFFLQKLSTACIIFLHTKIPAVYSNILCTYSVLINRKVTKKIINNLCSITKCLRFTDGHVLSPLNTNFPTYQRKLVSISFSL